MAEVSDTSIPYEILIRFDENGNLRGAHKRMRRMVKIDNEIVKNEPGDAEPISIDDGALWGVLDAAHTMAMAINNALTTQIAQKDGQIAALSKDLDTVKATIASTAGA